MQKVCNSVFVKYKFGTYKHHRYIIEVCVCSQVKSFTFTKTCRILIQKAINGAMLPSLVFSYRQERVRRATCRPAATDERTRVNENNDTEFQPVAH